MPSRVSPSLGWLVLTVLEVSRAMVPNFAEGRAAPFLVKYNFYNLRPSYE